MMIIKTMGEFIFPFSLFENLNIHNEHEKIGLIVNRRLVRCANKKSPINNQIKKKCFINE